MKKAFVIVSVLMLALLALAIPALAHESREVDPYILVFGLRNEPVFDGVRSGPELFVYQNNGGERGDRVEGGEFVVHMTAGDVTESVDLRPAFGDPGHYVADVIFTLPGDYSFHVQGTIEENEIDQTFNTADGSFGPVEPVGDIMFPEPAPGTMELLAIIADLTARIEALEAQ
jgi:hypothetical protein